MNNKIKKIAEDLRDISHPIRISILMELSQGKKCVNAVCDILKVSPSNMSQHISVLRKAGIIDYERIGNMKCYYIKKGKLSDKFVKFLKDYLKEE